MKYNPKIHNRQSIRLKGYDYSRTGLYFITVCAQNHKHLFGYIKNEKMHLNDAGKMVEKWYFELGNKYPNIKCDEHIVMPNHFHCIIEITNAHDMDAHVGTSLRGRPQNVGRPENDGCPQNDGRPENDGRPQNVGRPENDGRPQNVGRPENDGCPQNDGRPENDGHPQNDGRPENDIYTKQPYGPDNKKYNASIFDMMDWFKTMTTNAYIRGVKSDNWPRFEKRVWQKRYWDRIIRNENDYNRIANYIINNPAKWDEDQLNANRK